jgi:catechol 2,3-dioxygenase-like lactoylglutathione lyase family enzyme
VQVAARCALVLLAGLGFAALRGRRGDATRIVRISRVVADLERALAFYRDGLGFRVVSHGPGDPALPALLGLPGATIEEAVLRLGAEEIALVRFDPPGAPYPAGSRSDDLWFQHLAIVVSDMAAAYWQLAAQSPCVISTNGPERLPARNGGVTAVKFRDFDGHPLELIQFPLGQGRPVWQRLAKTGAGSGPFLGIDHTAMAVASTTRSLRFYRRLGFRVTARSWNDSTAQSRLDGVPGARVRVTGLRFPSSEGPGLELLRYAPPGRAAPAVPANALLTDWVTLSARHAGLRRDPDRHIMLLTGGR